MLERIKTWRITVRDVPIGDNAPVVIQSMTNTPTTDVDATVGQIEALAAAGCRIVRVAIPGESALAAFRQIRQQTRVPLVADIHFQYRLAIGAIEAGADKVRINPGNIGDRQRVRATVDAARAAAIPLRIGVNSGSLEKELVEKYGGPKPQALAESALGYIAMMEEFNFDKYIVSIKASDVPTTITACRLLAQRSRCPQHIGITESGTVRSGMIRSAVGLGALLADGIGDTIRVSLAGDPLQEVPVAREILKSLDLMQGPVVIACPTCGRTQIDSAALALKVEDMVAGLDVPIRIAVMGCIVNGPGEARDADVGIAGGNGTGEVFVKGVSVAKVPEEQLLDTLWQYIQQIAAARRPVQS